MPFRNKGAVMLGLDGRIAFASTYFCDLVGIQHDKVASRSYFDFVFAEDVSIAKQMLEEDRLPQAKSLRFRLRHIDGSTVWADVQAAPLQTTSGELYAISATVTAVPQVEEEPLPN